MHIKTQLSNCHELNNIAQAFYVNFCYTVPFWGRERHEWAIFLQLE